MLWGCRKWIQTRRTEGACSITGRQIVFANPTNAAHQPSRHKIATSGACVPGRSVPLMVLLSQHGQGHLLRHYLRRYPKR